MWSVGTTDEFDAWFAGLAQGEQEEIDGLIGVLKVVGPQLRRPHADTLNGSKYANMKELRGKTATSVLRVAFAFDPVQAAILLIGGDKSGVSEKRFYKQLIAKADALYAMHLLKVAREKREIEEKRMKGKGK
jgi:hypothetical protein